MNRDVQSVCESIIACGGIPRKPMGIGEWRRVFVYDSRGCQIGRLSFQHEELRNIKFYKPDYIRTVDESDSIALRFEVHLKAGILIPEDEFWKLEARAHSIVQEGIAEIQAKRDANPKKRKKIQGKNPRMVLEQLIKGMIY